MMTSGTGGRGVFALALLVGVGWRFHPGVIRAGSARPGIGGVSSRDSTRFAFLSLARQPHFGASAI